MAEADIMYAGSLYADIEKLAKPDCIVHNPNTARVVAAYEALADQVVAGRFVDNPDDRDFYNKDFIASTYNVVAESGYCSAILSLCQSAPYITDPAARAAIVRRLTALAAEHSAAAWWAPRLTARLIQLLSQ